MSFSRRAYDMDLGRRDHTRWLGSNRYAGGGPPPFSYADIPNQLLRINSLEGSLAFSGAVLTGVTDVSAVGGTVNVTGSPTYTAVDAGLNGAPSFTIAASSSVIAPNVNRALIRFVAAVVYQPGGGTLYVVDGTVASGRYFMNIDGNFLNVRGTTLAIPSGTPGRRRTLAPNDGATLALVDGSTLGSAFAVGSANGSGLRVGDAYVGGFGGLRLAFLMPCSSVPSTEQLAALEAKLITDFG